MRVLLVGQGGRENALAWRIARAASLTELLVTGENPGWPARVRRCPASSVEEQVAVARREAVDLVVVGPEGPIAEGLGDALAAAGVPCFGPTRAAGRLESSKSFAKEVLVAAGVPTPGALVIDTSRVEDVDRARARCARGAVVLKADGLAAGKGVVVAPSAAEALEALEQMARFGSAAAILVLEDLLVGPEVSVFALCDGARAVALPSAQDHKTLLDGGRGPNTGGMGAYVPCPLLDAEQTEAIVAAVHQPVLEEMARRGTPYRGVLYAGLMCTADGPRVLEFNARFGDPECQPLMMLWDEDVLPWLFGAATGRLPEGRPAFAAGSACCVVLASQGYPETSQRGVPIPEGTPQPQVEVFHAGTARAKDGGLVTAGGRVLGVTAVGPDLRTARARAYEAAKGWTFAGAQLRSDIGAQGLV